MVLVGDAEARLSFPHRSVQSRGWGGPTAARVWSTIMSSVGLLGKP